MVTKYHFLLISVWWAKSVPHGWEKVNWSIKIQPNLTQFNYLNVSWWWKSKLTGWGRPGELTIDAVSAVSESVLQLVAFLSDILLRELLTWSICKLERKYNIVNKHFDLFNSIHSYFHAFFRAKDTLFKFYSVSYAY